MHRVDLNSSRAPGGGLLATPCRLRAAFTLMELVIVLVVLAALAGLVVSNMGRTTDDAEQVIARAALQTVAEGLSGSAAGSGLVGDMRYLPEFRSVEIRVHDLLAMSRYPAAAEYDPVARRGWRGPYIKASAGVRNTNTARNGGFPASDERRSADDQSFLERGFYADALTSPYGAPGELAVGDPWGNPIVLQVPGEAAFSGSTGDAKRFRYARVVSAGADGVLTTPLDRLAGMQTDGTTLVRGDDLVLFLNRSDSYEAEEP